MKELYVGPSVDVIEFVPESGFAASGDVENSPYDYGYFFESVNQDE